MSARARAALGERDENHAAIEAEYRAHYCQVHDCHALGGGFPDLLVRIPTARGGILALVEVKSRDGGLSPSQVRFARDFGAVTVVRSEEEARAHIARVQEGAKR